MVAVGVYKLHCYWFDVVESTVGSMGVLLQRAAAVVTTVAATTYIR